MYLFALHMLFDHLPMCITVMISAMHALIFLILKVDVRFN